MPKLTARQVTKAVTESLPHGHARQLKAVLTELDRELQEKGLEHAVTFDPRPRTVEIDGTPFGWRIDAMPPDVLLAEGRGMIAYLAEKNPLEKYRLWHRMSYQDLSAKIGTPRQTLQAYCANINSPSGQMRAKIARGTGGEVPADAEYPLPVRDPGRPPLPGSRRHRTKTRSRL